MANAEHTLDMPADELFVSVAYADEGPTIKRWRPRARGRATRIRKRTSHLTIVVARFSDEQLQARRRREAAQPGGRRRGVLPRRRRGEDKGAAPEKAAAKAAAPAEAASPPAEPAAPPEEAVEEASIARVEPDAPAEELAAVEAESPPPDAIPDEKAARYATLGREEAEAASGTPPRPRVMPTRQRKAVTDGPEGEPLRIPSRDCHRLEVPLVRGS